jgi:DNA-binding beta-propeller fold protein YncE
MLAYFPTEFPIDVPPVPEPAGLADLIPAESLTIIGGPGTGSGQFSQPADVAVDAEGNLYVVDTLNHRVQKFTPEGGVTMFGEVGSDPGQFANPRSRDYEVDDGPWGIGIGADGNVYVADTWNHRVQKFGPDLEFDLEFGAGDLFGPRDIAIDPDGNVLVVDTGNKRIVKYTSDGVLVESFGTPGDGPAQFDEPSSISLAPNGDIYVADYWNQRIQHFNAEFQYVDQIEISSWGSQGITDRAYVAAADDNIVLATDPANGQILVFQRTADQEPTWEQLAAWRIPTDVGTTRPVGITVNAQGQVYISDSIASQVVRVPLTVLLGQQKTTP